MRLKALAHEMAHEINDQTRGVVSVAVGLQAEGQAGA